MKDVRVYECKDGRTRAYIKGTKKVVSYPRLILEEKLGRKLQHNEQVHHIDENPLNNNPDNLKIKMLGEHQREHNPRKYFDKRMTCSWCGKEFIWTAKQQSERVRNAGRKNRPYKNSNNVFCSKSCTGSFGRYVQLKNQH